jgi:chromosomal replication initiation ATPase DnaA
MKLSIETIQQIVCQAFGAKVEEIKSRSRDPGISDCRHASKALCAKHSDSMQEEIAAIHGGASGSVVSKSIVRAQELYEIDRAFRRKWDRAEQMIQANAGFGKEL